MRNGADQKKRATYADLLALPEHVVGEIIDGELIVSPRPAIPHARVYSVLGSRLGPAFDWRDDGEGTWWIFDEPELHFGEDVLIPDLAGWRRDRLGELTDVPWFSLAPDWLCEILSPSTARLDRKLKLPVYAREGVRHVWFIEPSERTLEVYRLEGGTWQLVATFAGEQQVRAEPFEALGLSLAELWLGRGRGAAAPESRP